MGSLVNASVPALDSLILQPNGSFVLDGLDFEIAHFDPDWLRVSQKQARLEPGHPHRQAGRWETRVKIPNRASPEPFGLEQVIVAEDGQRFTLDYTLTHAEGVPTRELALRVELPTESSGGRSLVLDGQRHTLPTVRDKQTILLDPELRPRVLVLPSDTGDIRIEGVFGVLVQDQRNWGQDFFHARLRFPLEGGTFTESSLGLKVELRPYRSDPIALEAAANRGLKDEVAHDGQGGWTDQGPGNDMSPLSPGPLSASGVDFVVIDESQNDGRAAVVLGRPHEDGLSQETVIRLSPQDEPWSNLYLLHAGAWLPPSGEGVGAVHVRYADGSTSRHGVVSGREVGNWWSPVTLDNGIVGWTGENRSSPVGLYVSRFPLERKPVTQITFSGEGNSLWMIVGLTGSPDEIELYEPVWPLIMGVNREWAAHEHTLHIEPDSVFDRSFMLDAPAGKYGPIQVNVDGHFVFSGKPDERQRFWGVNICSSANFLSAEDAATLASRIAATGYNTVRLHHYDRGLVVQNGPAHQIDPGQMEKLDRLFAEMKERGIYISIDLYSLRNFGPAEVAEMGLNPDGDLRNQFRALVPISDEAFEVWARFAEALLTHRNPYTGLTWGEDPALIGICPVNEDTLTAWIDRDPAVRLRYEEVFETWWSDETNRELCGGDRVVGFNRFVYEMQIQGDARMHAFIRSLGVTAPLTGANFRGSQGQTYLREHYDYVDNHQYWDHPRFPGERFRLPYAFAQGSAVRSLARTPRGMMAPRVWGLPYVVSEFNFVRPNQYRAEGGVIMPAYASLQDWDAIYNFEYSTTSATIMTGGTGGTFAIADDPVGLLADRVSALIFLRGDVDPAEGAVGFAVKSPDAFLRPEVGFPEAYTELGLVTRIGSRTMPAAEQCVLFGLDALVAASGPEREAGSCLIYPATDDIVARLQADGVLPAGSVDADRSRFVSDTGQIELNRSAGTMRVAKHL